MDFVRYADSLRAKLHMGGVKLPIMIGITACVLVALALAGFGLASVVGGGGDFTVQKASDNSVEIGDRTSAQEPSGTVFVHVGGAVANPGLYELAASARVQQAIEAAGGFSDAAATDALNLARVVADGEQIIVPQVSASEEQAVNEGVESSGSAGSAAVAPSGKVNINTASVAELQQLNGVGPSLAQRIVDDRKANGAFSTIEDLKRVSGIGDKKYAALADCICVG